MMPKEEGQVPDTAVTAGAAADAGVMSVEQHESPTTFLTNLSETLKSTKEVDVQLAGILIDHFLIVAPHANAVGNAKTEMVKLASQRAAPAPTNEAEGANG
jgi:hypothetical protein